MNRILLVEDNEMNRDMPEDEQKARAAGCDDFDTKPIEFARLLERIQAHLRPGA